MVRRSGLAEAPREIERVYARSGISSAPRNARRTSAPRYRLQLNRIRPAHLKGYKGGFSRGRARRLARNSPAARRCKCNRKVFAALRRDNRIDKERACQPDSPSTRNSPKRNSNTDSDGLSV